MNHSTLEKEQTGSLCSMIHKPFEETFLLSEQFFLLVLKRRNNDTISLIMKYFGGGAIQRQRWGYPPGLVTFWAAPTFQTSQVNRPAYFFFALLWTQWVDLSPFLHHVSMWPCAGGQIRVHGSGVHIYDITSKPSMWPSLPFFDTRAPGVERLPGLLICFTAVATSRLGVSDQ